MRMMQEDGLAVVRHVKQNLASGKVGVHGVSLGGSVASYVAANLKVDFLFVDRSFQLLQAVGYWWGGLPLLYLFKFLTFGGWPDESLDNFRNCKPDTYKLLSCDPNDQIIPEIASVKTGLAIDVIKSQFDGQFGRRHNVTFRKTIVQNHLLSDDQKRVLSEDLLYMAQTFVDLSFLKIYRRQAFYLQTQSLGPDALQDERLSHQFKNMDGFNTSQKMSGVLKSLDTSSRHRKAPTAIDRPDTLFEQAPQEQVESLADDDLPSRCYTRESLPSSMSKKQGKLLDKIETFYMLGPGQVNEGLNMAQAFACLEHFMKLA
jgi:hypothetical protein